jgi:signal transduction histidine kinase
VHLRVETGKRTVLCIEIVDDGAGLPDTLHAGIGLLSMRERALELGGECEVGNNPSGGTHVLVHLPIDERKV